ncbi:FeoA family protein [Fuscovulum blasticum]|uniref:FeoA family protein n=1 Tax=Fuscovulum blasticum TaxID=1075 RepID=UPI000D3E93FC|nr:ferrous iron transport protein A [Fuscovulum blasticum]AWD23196.1 iron transporter FeoA [Fuscovulum blasticum]
MMNARQIPLTLATPEAEMVVTGLAGCPDMRRRLADQGILIGARLRLVRGSGAGPLVLGIGAARLALCQDMARKILVTAVQDGRP